MTPRDHPPPPLAATLGILLLVASLGVRLYSSVTLYPGFESDPTVIASPILGLTPWTALVCDAAMMLGAGLMLVSQAARGNAPSPWEFALFIAGALGAIIQLFRRPDWFGDAMLGSPWVAAMFAGLAARAASRDSTLRIWLLAALLGLLPTLALKGAVQVYLEQPDTYREFIANKTQIFDAHGWTPDSPMARAFERRISQPEATAWFGLANVLSTLLATGAIAFAGLALTRRFIDPRLVRTDPFRRTWFVTTLLCAALCIAGTVWAGSKGGYAVLAAGLLLLVFAFGLASRGEGAPPLWRRLAPALGLLAVVGPIAAVALRGLLGPRLHELSLLFRSFYQVGAVRIFFAHPLLGVGPAEFKDAYSLVKLPIATEDVSSPHCLLLDHASTLGLFGLAWVALWTAWAVAAARSLASPVDVHDSPSPAWSPMRPHLRLLGAAIAIPVVIANFLEASATTPSTSAVRIGGLVLGVLAAGAVVRLAQARPALVRIAAAVAAVAAIAHCQIELTGVTPGAGAWVLMLLGVSAAPRPALAAQPSPRLTTFALPLAALAAALALPALALPRVYRFDTSLQDAYALITPFRELSARFRALSANTAPGDTPAKFTQDLLAAHADLCAAMTAARLTPPTEPRSAPAAMVQVQAMSAALAWRRLGRAWDDAAVSPSVAEQSKTRLMVAEAELRDQAARDNAPLPRGPLSAADLRSAAIEQAAILSRAQPTSSNLGWLGTLCQGLFDQGVQIDGLAPRALDAFRRAALKSPYSPLYPSQAALLADKLGRHAEAADLARAALDLDRNMQLDPLSGLPDAVRAKLERIVAQPPASGSAPAPTSNQTPIKTPSSPRGSP